MDQVVDVSGTDMLDEGRRPQEGDPAEPHCSEDGLDVVAAVATDAAKVDLLVLTDLMRKRSSKLTWIVKRLLAVVTETSVDWSRCSALNLSRNPWVQVAEVRLIPAREVTTFQHGMHMKHATFWWPTMPCTLASPHMAQLPNLRLEICGMERPVVASLPGAGDTDVGDGGTHSSGFGRITCCGLIEPAAAWCWIPGGGYWKYSTGACSL